MTLDLREWFEPRKRISMVVELWASAMSAARASLDWHYKGMGTLVLENETIRLVALVDKGSDII